MFGGSSGDLVCFVVAFGGSWVLFACFRVLSGVPDVCGWFREVGGCLREFFFRG